MSTISSESYKNPILRIGEPYNFRWPLLNSAQIRKLEVTKSHERNVQNKKITELTSSHTYKTKLKPTLMESAGLSLARLCLALAPQAEQIWIACGPGNNGGDGIVAALELQKLGKTAFVSVCGHIPEQSVNDSSNPTDSFMPISDHSSALQAAKLMGIKLHTEAPNTWDFAIDAILGIGLDENNPRPISGVMAMWLNLINTSSAPVLSVDTPSGLFVNTGHMSKFQAHGSKELQTPQLNLYQKRYTLTFLGLKPGLFTGAGKDFAGEVWFDRLQEHSLQEFSCEADLEYSADIKSSIDGIHSHIHLNCSPTVKVRAQNTHKGTFSDVIILGGAKGMQGAAILASTAALHMGAGRVYVCFLDDSAHNYRMNPALMTRFSKDLDDFDLKSSTLVCGCGAGTSITAYLKIVLSFAQNLVLDADALNSIAADENLKLLLKKRNSSGKQTVLTPHPLEAARLLGITTQEIQSNRVKFGHELARLFECTVVLKGAGSVIAQTSLSKDRSTPVINSNEHESRIMINPTGCPLLATAGTGDVLAGMIGSLLAQNNDPWLSTCEAVFIHGQTAQEWGPTDSFDAELLAQRVTYPRKFR